MRQQDLHELALEYVVVISYTDPGTKDEGQTHQEDHVSEIRRALEREFAENPYLTCQLSVFDD
jgi:lipoate synthase